MKSKILGLLAVGLLAGPMAANAVAIVYSVNQTIGSVSISGTLTTDGTIGAVTAANFIDFSLTVTNGISPSLFTPTNAFVSPGNTVGVVATATDLSLSNPFAQFAIYNPPPGDGGFIVWLVRTNSQTIQNPLVSPTYFATQDMTLATFARVVPTSGVPEPGSLALLGLGLAGLGLSRRRKAD